MKVLQHESEETLECYIVNLYKPSLRIALQVELNETQIMKQHSGLLFKCSITMLTPYLFPIILTLLIEMTKVWKRPD